MKKRIPAALLSLALCAGMALPAAALEVEDARTLLREHYISALPPAALEAQTLDELFSALNDPYTVYYTAEEYANFLSHVNGETLVGIGVSLQSAFNDGFELLSILPNSPALDAGLNPGDKIIAVDGVTLTAKDNITGLIAGEEGTEVTVTVRTPAGEVRDVTMVRRTVQVPIVTWEQTGGMGYIDCSSFGDSTYDHVGAAIREMDSASAVWVMDLRSNPGGTSDAAASVAGHFLGGQVMVIFRNGAGVQYETRTTALCPDLTDKPLIILTSPQSASASELFSAAIRDHRAGISIGQRTHGKGVAQTVYDEEKYPELFDADALKITTYRFFSPKGAANHLIGVIPTLLVDPSHTQAVAQILSAHKPQRSLNNLMLVLCGQTFYLDRQVCMAQPQAFTELLEALPPGALLYRGTGSDYWRQVTPQQVAAEYGLDYAPRTFPDLEGHPCQREINTLRTYGLVSGGDDGLFQPEAGLTRAQLCAMLSSALNLSSASPAPFSDVAADAWYADAVAAMTARGFMAGTGHNTFSPDAPLTRQELYTVYSAVAAWCSTEGYDWAQRDVSAVQWAEFYAYPEWAQGPARNLDKLGLEVDRENPSTAVSRAEAAGLLCRLLENIHVLWNQ